MDTTDPEFWHNLHERIAVAAFVIAGIAATAAGIWNMFKFTRKFATKEHLAERLADQEEKGRKELELCNVLVQSEITKVKGAVDTLVQTNDTKHDALDEKLDIVIGLVKKD